ncbi:MAG: cyclic nucleotide-binding domain-containing protein, partial [Leptolyngbya sp. SIO4C1]|nr:cyclic nucleotide-binding domain-containing protein [Leptolyngbya sp. SIO4C1]
MIDVESLQQIPHFAALSKQQLGWLIKQGNQIALNPGDLLISEGDPPKCFYILLQGQLQSVQNIAKEEIGFASYGPGSSLGEIHIALESAHLSDVRALMHCQLFELGKEAFCQVLATFPSVKRYIISKMEQHLHAVQSIQYHEKLVGLGTLAAGFAHELNNPAVAGNRAVEHLREHFERLQLPSTEVARSLL